LRFNQRGFARNRNRLLQIGRRHLQIQRDRLPDEHLDTRPHDVAESRQICVDLVRADADGNAVHARSVRDGFIIVASRFIDRGDGHTGQNGAR
jgi:hypothetical protein